MPVAKNLKLFSTLDMQLIARYGHWLV